MNYYDIFLSTKGNRDTVFDFALAHLQSKPARFLEIGTARDLNPAARKSDGWSTMHFARYVSAHGGSLDLVDVSNDSLANCRSLIDSIPSPVAHSMYNESGADFLSRTTDQYDMVLLDGSDDPNEMLQCFELTRGRAKYILCDDFHAKGSVLRERHTRYIKFRWTDCPHEMALYRTEPPFEYEERFVPHLEAQ